jgi:hypothetical protein
MNLSCPNCHRPLEPDDVDLKTSIGRCLECGRVFHLYDQIREATEDPEARARPNLGAPSRVKVTRGAGRLELRWSWFTPGVIFLVFFCCFWWGFLALWYGLSFFGHEHSGAETWIMRIFPLAHVGAGIWVAWKALTGLVNRTRIVATNDELSVKHGPIPGRRGYTVARADIDQLFTVEEPGNKTVSWQLRLRTRDRKVTKLLKDLENVELPLFIEQELEQFYGVVDKEVRGEVPR